MMKKRIFMVCVAVLALLPLSGVFAQGYTGPGSSAAPAGQLVTVADALKLRDDARVTLQGTIVRAVGREKYVFQDASGEINLEIDRRVWGALSVGENDRVEIYGEVDVDRRGVEIDVRTIKKL